MGRKVFTSEMINFISSHGAEPRSWITDKLNEMFSLSLTRKQVQAKCNELGLVAKDNGQRKRGVPSWNKGIPNSTGISSTRFKKGHNLSERVQFGYESVQGGFLMIKSHKNKPMRLKHHVVWEQHNGDIPIDSMVCFKDKDRMNCSIDNLILMTKAESIRLSQSFIKYSTPETHESCILLAKLKAARHAAYRKK